MSKKVVNLGKVKGRTLDLKVEDKTLKKKYDDQTEWEDVAELTGGVDVVDNANELPTDASENDIVFVENEAFIGTVEEQEEIPIVLTGGEQILNFELKQDTIFLSDIDLTEKHPELADENTIISVSYSLENSGNETWVQYAYYSASIMSEEVGVNHSLEFYTFFTSNLDESMTQWIKLRGMSIKDYFTIMLEFSCTEEELQMLLGEYYTDETINNPSYEWIKMYMTTEPLNENSIESEGMYITIEFDAVTDFKTTCVLNNFMIETYDSNGEQDIYIDTSFVDPEDYESEEFITALGYANTFVNLLFNSGVKDNSYDVYSKKGFYIYENEEWTSLEEKMNIPKIVEKHSDLPKSFIENGIMVVANEEEKLPEPTTKLEISVPAIIKVNPTPSIKDEVEKLKQYFIDNGASSDTDWDNCYVSLFGNLVNEDEEDIGVFEFTTYLSENGFAGIMLDLNTAMDDIYVQYFYFDDAGAEIYVPGIDNNTPSSTYITDEGKCWYRMEYLLGEKYDTLISPPQKVKYEDWFNISDTSVYCDDIYCYYDDDNGNYDDIEPSSYEFSNLFRIYDESKSLIYPKGFYMYAKNQWWHQPGIAGESFDNVDVLRTITAEDIGNIQLNTERSHEHTNKEQLDKIDTYFFQRMNNAATKAHYHNNQSYLDKITNDNYVHTHSNKDILDKLDCWGDLLIYSDKIVVTTEKQVLEADSTETTLYIYPNCFYEIAPTVNCSELTIRPFVTEHSPYLDTAQEYMFSINTLGLTYDIELILDPAAGNFGRSIQWISEQLFMLAPNKYYEFSIVDFKVVYISTEVGEV